MQDIGQRKESSGRDRAYAKALGKKEDIEGSRLAETQTPPFILFQRPPGIWPQELPDICCIKITVAMGRDWEGPDAFLEEQVRDRWASNIEAERPKRWLGTPLGGVGDPEISPSQACGAFVCAQEVLRGNPLSEFKVASSAELLVSGDRPNCEKPRDGVL